MAITDPIADMLTRIRNACMASFEAVDIPASKLKQEISRILKEEGYIREIKIINDQVQDILRLYLKYDNANRPIINNLKRISKPGRRVYVKKDDIPRVLGGLGIAILSTSKGIMTDKMARQQNVGGEILCSVW